MIVSMPNVLPMEVLFKNEQKQDDAGNWVNTGKQKPYLVCYPYGQDISQFGWAGLVHVLLTDSALLDAKSLCGKLANVTVNQQITKGGAVFYEYVSIAPMQKAA